MGSWRGLARLGSTLFAWGSALTVAACGLLAWRGQVAIMAVERVQSFGLAYAGRAGTALALAEAALVLLAWKAARSPRTGVRWLGTGALLAWALLWSVNALRWAQANPEPPSRAVVAAVLVSLTCVALAARAPAKRA